MHSFKPHFAIVESGVRINDLHVTFTQAFDLATLQHDAGFNHIQNGVVVPCLTIARNELLVLVAFFLGHIVLFSVRVA